MEDLDEEKQSTLLHFQAITNNENILECRKILEAANWSLETAVSISFAEMPSSSSHSHSPIITPVTETATETEQMEIDGTPENPVVIQDNNDSWIGSAYDFLTSFFKDIPAEEQFAYFISKYESRFGNIHPEFFNGSFKAAYNYARRKRMPLFVYIHSFDHPSSATFCESILNSLTLDVVYWGADISSSMGLELSSDLLNGSTFPQLGVIDTRSTNPVLSILLEGSFGLNEIVSAYNEAKMAYAPTQNNSLQENRNMNNNRTQSATSNIIQQQNNEYNQSLLDDQRKEKELEEKLKKEEEDRLKETIKLKSIEDRKKEFESILGDEPVGEDICSIGFRLPDGKRIQRKFKNSDNVNCIYIYLSSKGYFSEGYDYFTQFPRSSLNDPTKSLRESGLLPRGMVVVQEKGIM